MSGEQARRPRVVIVGGGFAGFHAARALSQLTKALDVEVILINPTDYFLYLPLLPEVAAGILDPRRVSVPLAATLPGVRLMLGTVDTVDLVDPEVQHHALTYDRLLLDLAPRVLPELDPRLGATADRVLRQRGVEVRLQTTVQAATAQGVRLSDGELVPSRSLIWCVGVRSGPLVASLGLPTTGGRLVVDEYLAVPGQPELVAFGDAAASRPHPTRAAGPDDRPARRTPGTAGRGEPGRQPAGDAAVGAARQG
jgi:NADH dehydrogenase FAD-containing subunit